MEWAVRQLPRIPVESDAGGAARQLSLTEYERDQERRLLASIEKVADQIELRHGDADLWLEKLEVKIGRRRLSRLKTLLARTGDVSVGNERERVRAERLP